jgi:DNA replication and repair protein RecF
VINQRNSLLKNDFSLKEKQSWDEQMINLGTDIIQYRLNFLDDFIPVLQNCYSEITGFTENIDIEYQCSFKFQKSQIKSDFHKKCQEILSNEKQYQRTLIGPHLDDIYFRINGQSVAKFASQGQKRSLVIALKIALAKMIHNNCGIYPILIFDDTLAELDISRSQNLINMLSQNHQLFIATPNLNHYSDFNLQILELEKIIHA